MGTFDLTPDPKVLIALTHTPLRPLDALCELIDNAIDSFQIAKLQGKPLEHPLVVIDLPRPSEVNQFTGVVRVRDNGPGLTNEMAEKAIRAGFSGNNPYDSLGLFGMGFNIATGKLGRITRFLTARQEEKTAEEVIINLDEIRKSSSYLVPTNSIEKLPDFEHGTLVEVKEWWPEGNPNSGFVRKLTQYGVPTVRREVGRRYAAILREKNIRIVINGEPCEPFEHCIWSESRYVERKGHGKTSAVFHFDEIVGSQTRCSFCTALVPSGTNDCPACGSSSFRTLEERIRGWVGIQRFDSETEFGIDLIRNGRAIRIGEKSAFFEYVNEFNRTTKDYPIDSIYGRIVGEIHLNHVPVDFLKQDFQRSGPEWQRAVSFIRGDTPLQPGKIKQGENNESPIFKLFQGYRRVRTPGKTDLYMGYWDPEDDRPKRISRDVEKEFYEKFKKKIPGYYDDSEWWKLVEEADKKPLEELAECPSCGAQNLNSHEVCAVCGHILIGKTCINSKCSKTIPQSAITCQECGFSQISEVQEPWICQVCGNKNIAIAETCSECGSSCGTLNPISADYLIEHSNKSDKFSFPGCSIPLADDSYSQHIDVYTYITEGPIIPYKQINRIPLIAFKGERIDIFIDIVHPAFKSYQIRPEQMIAAEIALYLYDTNRRLSSQQYQGQHTLSNIGWTLLNQRWSESLEDSAERVKEDIEAFFNSLKERLPALLSDTAQDFLNDLGDHQKRKLIENMLNQGEDISKINDPKSAGKFLQYADEETLVDIFRKAPFYFFDGKLWNETYSDFHGLPVDLIEKAQMRIRDIYLNCMQDIAHYINYKDPEHMLTTRARASYEFLNWKIR